MAKAILPPRVGETKLFISILSKIAGLAAKRDMQKDKKTNL
jgi:hypothetical protein